MVAGKPVSACARRRICSQAILSREYCQYGFTVGVDSVITQCEGGFSYTEAELMNTYCRASAKTRRSRSTWLGS